VSNLLTEAYAVMTFVNGFVHCDPHPGNLAVVGDAGGAPRLVLYDHGMYRALQPEFRRQYCALWRAMIAQDRGGVKACAEAMGVGVFWNILPLMFVFATADRGGGIATAMTEEEREELRRSFKEDFQKKDIPKFLESLPRDLLFVLRANGLVRASNKALGGATKTRLMTNARVALWGAHVDEVGDKRPMSWGGWLRYLRDRAILFVLVKAVDVAQSFSRVRREEMAYG
jgi:aarF domain-containing kinase